MTKKKDSAIRPKVAWGKYLLVFLIAAWMFFLGVMVGRGTAPVHFDIQALQNELADLRNTMVKKERETVEKAISGEDRKASLEFYEALKKDGLDTSVRLSPPGEQVSGALWAAQAQKMPAIPHKSKAPILGKNGKRAAVKKVKTPSPTSASNPAAGKLTIQVASLKNGTDAGRIVANLKKEGYPAYLSRTVIPKMGLWFRVRVGSYTSQKQAALDMDKLKKAKKNPILLEK